MTRSQRIFYVDLRRGGKSGVKSRRANACVKLAAFEFGVTKKLELSA